MVLFKSMREDRHQNLLMMIEFTEKMLHTADDENKVLYEKTLSDLRSELKEYLYNPSSQG